MSLILAFLLLFDSKVVSGPLTMAVSTQNKVLVVRVGPYTVKKYDVAVGSKDHPTPSGTFYVRHLVWNPAWVPPDANWAKGKQPAAPGDPKNPMRAVKLFFQEPDYYIHGTNDPGSIGEAASHGCIRMNEADAVELARYLMEQEGIQHDDDWYSNAVSSDKPTDVRLPAGIPLAIGK